MNDVDKPRLVSGEIMADARPRAGSHTPVHDFIDVDVSATSTHDAVSHVPAKAGPKNGLSFLTKRMDAATSSNGGPLFWTFGLGIVALAFWTSGGHALVRDHVARLAPGISQPILIDRVSSRVERHDGREVLFLEGHAKNPGSATQKLPSLAIVVKANDGTMKNYFLGTNDIVLASGDSYAFSSRLDAPTDGVKSVSITFREPLR